MVALWLTLALVVSLSGVNSSPSSTIRNSYDYIIVGGGTAGLTVGDRLSESGQYSVLVVEYGHLQPDGFVSGQTTYNITSAPVLDLKNRSFPVEVGCIVGGSSAVNGMIFQRGSASDYNIWGELDGGKGSTWNWPNLLGYFKKGIQLTPPKPEIPAAFNLTYDTQYWGQNLTTNHTIFATYGNVIKPAVYPAYQTIKQIPGMNLPPDGGSGQLGMFYALTSSNPYTGQRSYSRTGHWDGLNRPNYHLLTATRVNKVVIEGGRAVGVQITPRGGKKSSSSVIKIRKEVIVAAGAIHTPHVLQLSGIGPADVLRRAKIPVKVDLPGVGSNFQDHTFIPSVSFRLNSPLPVPPSLIEATNSIIPDFLGNTSLGISIGLPAISPTRFASIASAFEAQSPAQYLPKNTHPTIIAGYQQQKRIYSREMRRNDLSFIRLAVVFALSGPDPLVLSWQPINIHPLSRGTVLLNTTHPEGEPVVSYRANSNPLDFDLVIEQIGFLRRMAAAFNATMLVPGPEVTDANIKEWLRGQIVPSVYHPVGTAPKMPREWGGVVEEDLKVYGVRALRVVDASVFPTLVGATTSMSVYAVAEKVSFFLDNSLL
ncbi:hypothetical protein QBC35DRAFT_388734 [Podospora australis]|uniref:Glucose-methanol-choline oxidoreductase N-terminal domain-containing protein n=1 Tax=Podospora australis TaxID=1536484 RepID=A0AAN6WSV0_9PEZI|nr:hypothetical protein QBC35DRAFT_388734 [Podospora australis]